MRKIIVAMVRQMKIETHRPPDCLGDMPSLFGTLTSQWYYWDEIIRLIANVEGISEDYKTLNKSKRSGSSTSTRSSFLGIVPYDWSLH